MINQCHQNLFKTYKALCLGVSVWPKCCFGHLRIPFHWKECRVHVHVVVILFRRWREGVLVDYLEIF